LSDKVEGARPWWYYLPGVLQLSLPWTFIWIMGVIDPLEREADPGFLRQLSSASGGESFEPHSVAEVARVLRQVAHDIRNMYTVGYVPSVTGRREELRNVSVEVSLPGGGKAKVRTRRAYLAGQEAESLTDDDRQ